MQRRQFIRQMGVPLVAAAALSESFLTGSAAAELGTSVPVPATPVTDPQKLAPIRADIKRITGVYTCTRPFRRAGPRIELERFGHKHVVHNYGHGGSGWSLSWGSGTLAVRLAQSTGARSIAVLGCGALGLTAALVAQRAGLSVRIYAKALPPEVPSSNATGIWTPDSRICDAAHAPDLLARWKEMAQISFTTYQKMLGLPGNPVEWIDFYRLSDEPFGASHSTVADEPEYGDFGNALPELNMLREEFAAGTHGFHQPFVRRSPLMMFNLSSYAHMLMSDFLANGGKVEIAEFSHASQLLKLPEKTLINATGYGARALFNDESVIPVRGQTARLIPQPEVRYGLRIKNLSMVPRSDGLLVQVLDDPGNFNNSDATPDRQFAEESVRQLAQLLKG